VQRRTLAAAVVGALLGGVLSIAVLALAASRVIGGGVQTGGGGTTFFVGEGAMDLLILIGGTLGGALLGAVGYAIARETAPDGPRVAPAPLLILGAVVGAVVGFAVARAGLGIAAQRTAEIVTIPVFRAAVVALIAGGTTGGLIGATVERLSRPEAFAFGGEAWPSSPVEFIRDAVRAVGLPTLGILVAVGVVFGLSRLLLDAPKEVGLIVFGGVAAVVLFGAAFIASHPPRRED
jgi:hypothetical protein